MKNNRFSGKGPIYSAMVANDPLLLMMAWGLIDSEPEGSLKEGEVAYGSLNKPILRIFDPNNPTHYIIRKNNLKYLKQQKLERNTNTVFMNLHDSGYFKSLGFEAGDEVYIVEE